MDRLRQDLVFALRSFRRNPLLTFAAVCTLAIGIGANAAIFSVFDAVLIEPLPYDEPDRLALLWHRLPGLGAVYSHVSTYVFCDWNKCGEVMGLAPYGTEGLPRLVELRDGELKVNAWPCELTHPFDASGDRSWEKSRDRKEWEHLCYRVQADTEESN